jgi:hypothetical protein
MNNIGHNNDYAYSFPSEASQGWLPSSVPEDPSQPLEQVASMGVYIPLRMSPEPMDSMHVHRGQSFPGAWPQQTATGPHPQMELPQTDVWQYTPTASCMFSRPQQPFFVPHPPTEENIAPPSYALFDQSSSRPHAPTASPHSYALNQQDCGTMPQDKPIEASVQTDRYVGGQDVSPETHSGLNPGVAIETVSTQRKSEKIRPTEGDFDAWYRGFTGLPVFSIILREVYKSSNQTELHEFIVKLHDEKIAFLNGKAQGRRGQKGPSREKYLYDVTKKLATKLKNKNLREVINSQDAFGRTVAHYATIFGELGALELLGQHGADLKLPDYYGATAEAKGRYSPYAKKMQDKYSTMGSK